MKYPEKQFDVLCESLKKVSEVYGKETLLSCPIHSLHFFVYSQKNFDTENLNVRILENGQRLFDQDEAFLLYPEGCNDNHIETAMKQALKTLNF